MPVSTSTDSPYRHDSHRDVGIWSITDKSGFAPRTGARREDGNPLAYRRPRAGADRVMHRADGDAVAGSVPRATSIVQSVFVATHGRSGSGEHESRRCLGQVPPTHIGGESGSRRPAGQGGPRNEARTSRRPSARSFTRGDTRWLHSGDQVGLSNPGGAVGRVTTCLRHTPAST
jgi:hypothetical protein